MPSVEIVMKDAQGYKEYKYDFQYYRATESYLDMIPMTVPTQTQLSNTRDGTMAEMTELVKNRNKPLAQFVPIPDWAMWRKGMDWDKALPNTVAGAPAISPREAYFNNDSACCYALSDRLAGDKIDQEKADQRILLPFQEKIKATVLTADDTDSIDYYFKDRGKYLDLGDNTKKPNKPDPAMNSLIYPGERIPRATVAQTTNIITGMNQLINAEYRLCANSNDSKIRSWECNISNLDNRWEFSERDSDGYGMIALNGGSYCLDSRGELGQAIIWPCFSNTNGLWKFRSDGSLVDKTTKGCLALTGTQSGNAIETQPCNGSGRQQWLTDYAENTWGNVGGGSTRMLGYDKSSKCFRLNDQTGKEYTSIWLDTCAPGDPKGQWSTWTSMVNGQGGYAPVLESNIKDESSYFNMCALYAGGSWAAYARSCKNRNKFPYQWYFTPDRQIIALYGGYCLSDNGLTASCKSINPDTWSWIK